jgi:hypothetical protein
MALWGKRHGAARPEAAVEPQRPHQRRYHQQAADDGQAKAAPLTCIGGCRHARRTNLVVQTGHSAALPFGFGLAQGVEDVGHAAVSRVGLFAVFFSLRVLRVQASGLTHELGSQPSYP